jgi:hypothetical protein
MYSSDKDEEGEYFIEYIYYQYSILSMNDILCVVCL